MTNDQLIRQVNEAYVRASLADEFVCIESDGSVLNKAAFLEMTSRGSDLASYKLEQVDVRFYGDVALVRCTGSWVAKDGTPGLSRYVDIYVRIGDE